MMTVTVTRLPGERIFIGDDIIVAVKYGKRGSAVRVSVTAPPDVLILREELVERHRLRQSFLESLPQGHPDSVPRKGCVQARPETKTQADPQASQALEESPGESD